MAENKYPLTTDRLQTWLNVRIRRMQRNLAADKSNNSGALRQSLGKNYDKSIKQRGGFIIGTIQAEDYWYYVDAGVRGVGGKSDITDNEMPNQNNTSEARYKSKKPPLFWNKDKIPRGPIGDWVRTKLKAGGNDLFTALNIREGIYRKGIKGNKFASSVLTDKDLKELYESLAEKLAEDVANQMFE